METMVAHQTTNTCHCHPAPEVVSMLGLQFFTMITRKMHSVTVPSTVMAPSTLAVSSTVAAASTMVAPSTLPIAVQKFTPQAVLLHLRGNRRWMFGK